MQRHHGAINLINQGCEYLNKRNAPLLIKITKAYRTTSADALPVVAVVPAIALKIKEMKIRYWIRRR